MTTLRMFLLICLIITFSRIEGFGQVKEYFFVKKVSYRVDCDSLFGSGFTIITKGKGYFFILPNDSIMSISIVDKANLKTYKAFSKKADLEPDLYLARGYDRVNGICGEYILRRKINILDKDCFYKSQIGVARPDIEFTNIKELSNTTGYRLDLVRLKITSKGSHSYVKLLIQPEVNNTFGQVALLLKNDLSYIMEASIVKYSIQTADGNIHTFETSGKRKINFEVK